MCLGLDVWMVAPVPLFFSSVCTGQSQRVLPLCSLPNRSQISMDHDGGLSCPDSVLRSDDLTIDMCVLCCRCLPQAVPDLLRQVTAVTFWWHLRQCPWWLVGACWPQKQAAQEQHHAWSGNVCLSTRVKQRVLSSHNALHEAGRAGS